MADDIVSLSVISIFLPTIFGAILLKKLPNSLRVLTVFVFIVFLLEIITHVMYKMGVNNMAIFHAYTLIEFTCISLVYYFVFNTQRFKRICLGLIILFAVVSAFNWTYFESFEQFNSYQRVIEYVFLMVYFVSFIKAVVRSSDAPFLELHPYFVLTSGFLIYFTGTLILFLNAKELLQSEAISYWMIHGVLNIFLNIIYTIVLWRGSRIPHLL